MNTSRIEVPLNLAPPQFEDESTVATARQVKPIGRAKVTFRLRKVRAMVPLLLGATLCGALGASAVNYYERRRQVTTATTTAPRETPVTTTLQPASAALSSSSELGGGRIAENQTGAALAKDSKVEIDEPAKPEKTKDETETAIARNDEPREAATPKPKKSDGDPSKLTRQRRVRAADEPANKNGAGRIADLFSRPNP